MIETIESLIYRDPQVCGGAACAKGTRVPVQVLTDLIRAGEPVERIHEEYPDVDLTLIRLLYQTDRAFPR